MKSDTNEPNSGSSNRSTKLLIIGFSVALFAVLAWIGCTMWEQLPVKVEKSADLTFPLSIEGVTVTDSSHQWREVEANDTVQQGTLFIPHVALQFDAKTTATFICFFEDNEGNLIGDSITFKVQKGKVEQKSNHTIHCSCGFTDRAIFKGYQYSTAPFWHLVLQKSQRHKSPTLIARIPLPPNQ